MREVNSSDSREVLAALRELLSEVQVLDDPESLTHYGTDWSGACLPAPLAIVFPRTVEDVVDIVRLANEGRLSLVPSGGRTGLSGGAVAARGELVVSLRDMNRVLAFDDVDRTVRVEAGVVTATVQAFARERGLYYPVDFASSGSSQIGGNVATNAGGLHVVRYGSTREWVAGLKVVTGSGEVLDLNRGLVKNATGYDLRHLFIGSEGTLGIVVEATLRLTEPPGPRAVVLFGVPEMPRVLDLFRDVRGVVLLSAFEMFSDLTLVRVLATRGGSRPFKEPYPYYALAEIEYGDERSLDAALAVAQQAVAGGIAADAIVAIEESERRELWRLRESIAESIAPLEPYKNDVSVVISAMPEFLAAADREISESCPGFEVLWYGHIGDGNLHVSILRPDGVDKDEFRASCDAAAERLGLLLDRFGGSVSAEHGVGLLKKKVLHHSRSAAEIAAMREIKKAFDPNGILNPGKIFP